MSWTWNYVRLIIQASDYEPKIGVFSREEVTKCITSDTCIYKYMKFVREQRNSSFLLFKEAD